ncbi:MAG: hypothetical protein NXH83_02480 [Rhodobacteraceae bacterium]|nr:hypothetical protein [Paracoccaceae bacterium]
MTRALPILALCLAALAGPAAALLAAPPRAGEPVLVILAPGADADSLLAAAGARPIGPLTAPMAVLATGEGADLATRLVAAGAWAVRDGAAMARLCGY